MTALQIISSFIPSLIQMILLQATVLNLFRVKCTTKRIVITVLITYVPTFILRVLLTYHNVAYHIIWIALLYICYYISYKQSIWISLIMPLVQIMISTITEYGFILLLSLSPEDVQLYLNENRYILQSVIVVFFILLYSISNRINSKLSNLEPNVIYSWILYLLFPYLISSTTIRKIEADQIYTTNNAEIINMVLIIAFVIYNLVFLKKQKESFELTKKLELEERYSQSLNKVNDELRGFKHDFSNLINTIMGYAEIENWTGLKSYIAKINIDFSQILTRNTANQDLKEMPDLYGLMLSKLSFSEVCGVQLSITLLKNIDTKYLSPVDFSRMVGILLDNAIEAAKDSDEKYVLMEFTEQDGISQIMIENSIGSPVDTNAIYRQGYTTKTDHSGVGLYQVNNIVAKYQEQGKELELETTCTDTRFRQCIKI